MDRYLWNFGIVYLFVTGCESHPRWRRYPPATRYTLEILPNAAWVLKYLECELMDVQCRLIVIPIEANPNRSQPRQKPTPQMPTQHQRM
eukprot:237769-Amorphochlora_amoeboformis.AAC.1